MAQSFDVPKWKSLVEKRIQNSTAIEKRKIAAEIEFYLQSAEDAHLQKILTQLGLNSGKLSGCDKEAQIITDFMPKFSAEEQSRLEFRCKFLQMPNLLDIQSSKAPLKDLPKPVLFTPKQVGDDGADDKVQQERLTEFLGLQTSRLLENSKTLHSELLKDNAELTLLENEMTDRDIKLAGERARINQISASGWNTTLLIWGSILLSILAFMAAFLYMRLFGVIKLSHTTKPLPEIETPKSLFEEFNDQSALRNTDTFDSPVPTLRDEL